MKKQTLILVSAILIIYLLLCLLLFNMYMKRVEKAFKNIKEDTEQSAFLEKEIGKIQKVKFNNFMKWISHKKGKECIEMSVSTSNDKYNICVIIEKKNQGYESKGYIIDNHIYIQK